MDEEGARMVVLAKKPPIHGHFGAFFRQNAVLIIAVIAAAIT